MKYKIELLKPAKIGCKNIYISFAFNNKFYQVSQLVSLVKKAVIEASIDMTSIYFNHEKYRVFYKNCWLFEYFIDNCFSFVKFVDDFINVDSLYKAFEIDTTSQIIGNDKKLAVKAKKYIVSIDKNVINEFITDKSGQLNYGLVESVLKYQDFDEYDDAVIIVSANELMKFCYGLEIKA